MVPLVILLLCVLCVLIVPVPVLCDDSPVWSNPTKYSHPLGAGDKLSNHNKVDNCWVVLNSLTLDLSRFDHPLPGGIVRIQSQCGSDVTNNLHAKHQDKYDTDLTQFQINHSTGKFLEDQRSNPFSLDGTAHVKFDPSTFKEDPNAPKFFDGVQCNDLKNLPNKEAMMAMSVETLQRCRAQIAAL